MPERTRWRNVLFAWIDEIEERFEPWLELPRDCAARLAEVFALAAPMPTALVGERRQVARALNTSADAVRSLGGIRLARRILRLRDFHQVGVNLGVTVVQEPAGEGLVSDDPAGVARFGWELTPRRTITQRQEVVYIGVSLLMECGAPSTGRNSAFELMGRAMDLIVPAKNSTRYDAESVAREFRRAQGLWRHEVHGRIRSLLHEFRRAPHAELGAFVRTQRWEHWTPDGGLPIPDPPSSGSHYSDRPGPSS